MGGSNLGEGEASGYRARGRENNEGVSGDLWRYFAGVCSEGSKGSLFLWDMLGKTSIKVLSPPNYFIESQNGWGWKGP